MDKIEQKIKNKICQANKEYYTYEVAQGFEDTIYNTKLHLLFDEIKKNLHKEDNKVIEIGCGSGRITKFLYKQEKIKQIYCLDLSENMLKVLKSKLNQEELKKAFFICEDATNYFRRCQNKFDIIIISSALHHIYDYLELLNFCSQKLNERGFIYIYDEPLPINHNGYLNRLISYWDMSFNEERRLRKYCYFIYGLINFISPIFKIKFFRKIKKKLQDDEEGGKYIDYWAYKKEKINLNKIMEIFEKNEIKIIRCEKYTGDYSTKLSSKIANFFKIKDVFYLVGAKEN